MNDLLDWIQIQILSLFVCFYLCVLLSRSPCSLLCDSPLRSLESKAKQSKARGRVRRWLFYHHRSIEFNFEHHPSIMVSGSREHQTVALGSFAAGMATATLLIWWTQRRTATTSAEQHWIEPILHGTVEEWKSRIGELPSRSSMKWPWDKLRRTDKVETAPAMESIDETLFTSPPQDKTGLCIGSIFGLDVGGTLAKLVYFEERQVTATSPHDEPIRRRTSTDDIWEIFKTKDDSALKDNRNSMPNLTSAGTEMTASTAADGHDQKDEPPENDHEPPENNTKRHLVRSLSMFDVSHAEALGQFYQFANTFDTYQTGVKDSHLSFYSRELGGDFHFIQFETRHMDSAMDLILSHNLHLSIKEMGATGGGAHKFANAWERVLGIDILKQEELDSLVAGMQFVMSTVVGECYTFLPKIRDSNPTDPPPADSDNATNVPTPSESAASEDDSDHDAEVHDEYQGDDWWWSRKVQRDVVSVSDTYPYLLVTIGTGVSILRVDGPREHERISGSTIGGGTYWGLIRLLTDIDDFEAVMKMAEKGDPSKVDMMVGDIYGKNSDALEKIGLPSNLVASSFGKLVAKRDPAIGLKQEDLVRALLLMVTNNIGQVSYLNAKLHNTPRIYFIGNFLRGNKISEKRLAYAINYWSKGEMEALFLEHEGYFGALGAFLLSQGISHGENGFFQWDKPQSPEKDLPGSTSRNSGIRPAKPAGMHRRSKTTG